MKTVFISSIIISICLLLNYYSFQSVKNETYQAESANQLDEVMYMPNGTALSLISAGYKNVLANVIWFNTLNYFGKHYKSDQKYNWLEHMCNLILDLDPRSQAVYEFCGLILSWEVGNHQAALNIYTRAINNDPGFWRYYYLRAMTYMLFLKDDMQTIYNLEEGAKQKNAPAFMAESAARKRIKKDDPNTALTFLEEMIRNSEDQRQKEVLFNQYLSFKNQINKDTLKKLVTKYKDQHGTLPKSLNQVGADHLKDPYGGVYFINEDGSIGSTSHKSDSKILKLEK